MSGLDRTLTPKTRPVSGKRTALVASLDIGTSKIACMIARLKLCPPSDALRGRTHAVELIGYSQIQSRGMKAGAVVDLAECENSIRQAVALAEGIDRLPAMLKPRARTCSTPIAIRDEPTCQSGSRSRQKRRI